MSFKLNDIVIDRVHSGVAESLDGELLYLLTQLADATIDVTAETKDAVDAQGNLIKRFYKAKQGTFKANNAMVNVNIMAAKSGSGIEYATNENAVIMPKTITVKAGEKVTLTNYVEGTVKVSALGSGDTLDKAYTLNTSASETEFAIDGSGVLTLPEDSDVSQFYVKYQRKVTKGLAVHNKADKFPSTIKLTLKVLAVDPCHVDTLKAGYIEILSFQPSPEMSLSLTTDAQLEYSGDLQMSYCSGEKVLFSFYWADEDEE